MNKLWGLTAGVLTGAAVLGGSGSGSAAASVGLAAGLLSTMALGWSSSRSLSTARSSEYSFIVDRSVQTLDRDLPLVIERIRQAGLAPVFLIDELDKVERPEECIGAIIRRLKNFTTDYGFFCFLTDRNYFDLIEQRVRNRAFPVEHTFFSHRLLVIYRPAELANYVRSLWTPGDLDVPSPTNDAERHARPNIADAAAWVVTCVALHRARLNSMDLRREWARLCHGNNHLRADPLQIALKLEYLVPTAIQLAIEHVLRDPTLALRVAEDDRFAQLAFDVLYRLSRAWEDGEDDINISYAAVRDDLLRLRDIDQTKPAAMAEFAATVPKPDLETLVAALQRLAWLLQDFGSIATAILSEPDFSPLPLRALPPFDSTMASERARIAALTPLLQQMPSFRPGLVEGDLGRPDIFTFRFDRFGSEYFETVDVRYERAVAGADALDALDAVATHIGLTPSSLIAAGILPRATMDERRLYAAAQQVRALQGAEDPGLSLIEDLALLIGLPGNLTVSGKPLIAFSSLVLSILNAEPRVSPAAAVVAIDRMLGIDALYQALTSGLATATSALASCRSPTSRLAEALLGCIGLPEPSSWRTAISRERDRLRATGLLDAVPAANREERAERVWRSRVERWLLTRLTPVDPPIEFADLIDTAAGLLLPNLLRPDMETMTVSEWSRFCTRMRNPEASAISWGFVAGLRALNFGSSVLQAAAPTEPRWQEGARPDQPAILYTSPLPAELDILPNAGDGPVMWAAAEGYPAENGPAVEWLIENNAIGAVI